MPSSSAIADIGLPCAQQLGDVLKTHGRRASSPLRHYRLHGGPKAVGRTLRSPPPKSLQPPVLLGQQANADAWSGDDEKHGPAGVVETGERIRRQMQDEVALGQVVAHLGKVTVQIGLPDNRDVTAVLAIPDAMVEQAAVTAAVPAVRNAPDKDEGRSCPDRTSSIR